ncbi:MAG TPA: radical SAM protein, partial [Planctomycetota bacterium]|nr:radical SAM protein [Planctomycetota bacterium]
MEESVQRAFDATRDFRGKALRSACYAPFVSLNFNTRGDVVACCKNQIYVLGNVGTTSLDEIWNGPKVRILRRALERYDYGAGCEFCEWQVRAGDYRGAFSRRFDEFAVEEPDPRWPATMEFTISNTCNYECIMCSGELSSSIRARREGLPPMPKVYGDAFFADLRKYLPHLRSAVFMGGEPFLAHENYRVWEMMIEGASGVPCHVITNGSQWNERVERILERLPVHVCVSLDGATKETVESIRVNARFEIVMENIRRFLASTRRRGTGFSLSYCLMRQNWREFGTFLRMAEELGCATWINTVLDPPTCSLYTLPSDELGKVIAAMEAEEKDLLPGLRINRQVWLDGVGSLRKQAAEQQGEALDRVKTSVGGRSHVAVAWELAGQGRLEDALREVLRTPETYPYYYQSIVAGAHFRRRLGDREGALRDLERAIALTRRRPEPYLERAWLRLEAGEVEEALADGLRAREALREGDEMEPFVHDLLGLAWCRKG